MSGLFGGGESTTTSQQQYPKYIEDAQKQIMAGAGKGMSPYLSNPSAFVAPMNDYQTAVGTGAQGLAGYAQGKDYSGQAAGMLGALAPYMGSNASGAMDPYVGGNQQGMANGAIGRSGDMSLLSMDDINAFANPLAEQMTDVGMRRLGESYDRSNSDVSNQAAAAGAFGGSNEAIRRNMLDEDMAKAAGDLSTQIAYDSFGQGAQLAGQNVGIENDAIARQASAMMQGAGMDMQAQNDYYNRGLGANQFNQQAQNDYFNRGMSGANFNLGALGQASGMSNDYLTRNLGALGALSGYGDQLQNHNQQVGDKDWTSFARFAGQVPGVQPTTSQTQPTNNSGWLGAGLTALSMF